MIGWEAVASFGLVSPTVIPPVSDVIAAFVELFRTGRVFDHIAVSLKRLSVGFGLSAVAGVTVGLMIGEIRTIYELLNPLVELLRPIAPIALYPVFILLFGLGFLSKVAIIAWVCFFPIVLNTVEGVQSIDSAHRKAALSMNASRTKLIRSVVLPGSAYWIVTGLRIGAGSGFLALIAAEMIGATDGLGYFIIDASRRFQTEEMYAGIVLIGIVGYVTNAMFLFAESWVIKWRD
jgi:NitT/TauT family transport system permease protein